MKRHVADKILVEEARKRITAKDSTLGERAAVWAAIKAETKIDMDMKTKKKKLTNITGDKSQWYLTYSTAIGNLQPVDQRRGRSRKSHKR